MRGEQLKDGGCIERNEWVEVSRVKDTGAARGIVEEGIQKGGEKATSREREVNEVM
jgi:hypothetical protein